MDVEEQQKQFHKSKQKIIHSAPIVQERTTNESDQQNENVDQGPSEFRKISERED